MPEAPEVRRIVDQMEPLIVGKTLKDITFQSGRYMKKLPDGYKSILADLPLKINKLNCKGKFIYFEMDSRWSIWNTLGMSGGWINKPGSYHQRACLEFVDADPIFFIDIRNFGTLKFVNSPSELTKKLQSLGPDVLTTDVSFNLARSKIKNRYKKTLAEILMDQSFMAGVGNYIKAEALYLAKLSPHRKGGSLTDEEIDALNKAIHSVVRESYKSGGSTFKTYADFNGDVGTFTSRFMVYGLSEDPQGNPVIKEETLDKRTTHWVPAVQK